MQRTGDQVARPAGSMEMIMQAKLYARPGVSMVEVIVAFVLASVIGATATSAFVTQSRFFDVQEKTDFARGVSRGAMNMIVSELRMLEQGGAIESASTSRITVRAPYALGLVCGTASPHLTISRLPADPRGLKTAVHSGIAFRNRSTGNYTYIQDKSTKPTPKRNAASVCTAAGVSVYQDGGGDSDGEVMQGKLPAIVPDIGAPVFLYQRITYEFKASRAVPGRVGLWRLTEDGGSPEEIVAPFETTAGFRFYVSDAAAATGTVPGALSTITGIELQLDGLSERPEQDGSYRAVPLSTSVFFKNRPSS
jgi:type II secretory pathway pseudopilin PulG